MLKIVLNLQVYLFLLAALDSCIDPYNPQLDKYQSLLVVEGLITDEKVPYEVILSRTFQSIDSIPEKISDAKVFITDENGNMTALSYSGNGRYVTDSTLFSGEPGKTYTLHIETSNGNEYASEPCVMTPVTDIDSIYYEREEEIDESQSKLQTGIAIFLDSDEAGKSDSYFRWEYEETWKFKSLSPARYNYISETLIVPLKNVREYCWKSNKSGEIITGSVLQGHANLIKKEPVVFIPSDQSDRLTIQYSILIKQYSVSPKEFDFWNNLKQVNETGGDIFEKQPYSVISNVQNVDNPEERVLGYFKVSAVKTKRLYITPRDIQGMMLPHFDYDCKTYIVSPEDYQAPWSPPVSFNDIYNMFKDAGEFTFVEPLYNEGTTELYKLVFVQEECSDCGLTGNIDEPDFWIDLP